jgi:hemolysin III
MQHPVRGFLHGGAAIASVAALAVMLHRAWGDGVRMAGAMAFGLGLLAVYSVSALYHSVPWSRRWKRLMQRVDHSMIFLLVTGTCTPLVLVALGGWWRAVVLSLMWSAAVTGIALKLTLPKVRTGLSVAIQHGIGWAGLGVIPALWSKLGVMPVLLTVGGGITYALGSLAFVTRWPRLSPRVFSYHETFHVMVVIGSVLHFVAIHSFVLS